MLECPFSSQMETVFKTSDQLLHELTELCLNYMFKVCKPVDLRCWFLRKLLTVRKIQIKPALFVKFLVQFVNNTILQGLRKKTIVLHLDSVRKLQCEVYLLMLSEDTG